MVRWRGLSSCCLGSFFTVAYMGISVGVATLGEFDGRELILLAQSCEEFISESPPLPATCWLLGDCACSCNAGCARGSNIDQFTGSNAPPTPVIPHSEGMGEWVESSTRDDAGVVLVAWSVEWRVESESGCSLSSSDLGGLAGRVG